MVRLTIRVDPPPPYGQLYVIILGVQKSAFLRLAWRKGRKGRKGGYKQIWQFWPIFALTSLSIFQ